MCLLSRPRHFQADTYCIPEIHKSSKNQGFLMPFLREVICYKALMYFSSPPPFLDSSRYNPGIKRLTLSQSWGCLGHYKFMCPIDFGPCIRTTTCRHREIHKQVHKLNRNNETERSLEFWNFNTVWMLITIMVVMSKVMGNNKHLHYLQKNMGTSSWAVLVNSHKCQEMHMCEFANNYEWVFGKMCVGLNACVQVCAWAQVANLSARKYVYELIICFAGKGASPTHDLSIAYVTPWFCHSVFPSLNFREKSKNFPVKI